MIVLNENILSRRPKTYTISRLYKWYKDKRLILKPPYQRESVWNVYKKSYLIDTILKNFPVPDIHLNLKKYTVDNTVYETVDGQQRLVAIFEFIDGKYQLSKGESDEYSGKALSDLPTRKKEDFWNYQLVVRELKTNDYQYVKETFQRLNKNNMVLKRQELRHAKFTGHFIKLVEQLTDDIFWKNGIFSQSEINRMRDKEFVSELLVGMIEGVQQGTTTLDKFYESLDTEFKEKKKWQKRFQKTLKTIQSIFPNLMQTHWKEQGDFYALFIAISKLLEDHVFSPDRANIMREELEEFRRRVNTEGDTNTHKTITEYHKAIGNAPSNKKNRNIRTKIIYDLLLPSVIPIDDRRDFSAEQRQQVWDRDKNNVCGICSTKVSKFDDYECDHIIPHSKGGMTIVSNAQVTHAKHNRSKGNKYGNQLRDRQFI